MNVDKIAEVMLLKDRRDVVRIHFYIKLIQKGIVPYDKDLDVLINLYEMGGYSNEKEQLQFFNSCIYNKYKKSIQSIRNTLAKYTEIGVLNKPKNKKRFISDVWMSPFNDNILFLDYKISHTNAIH